MTTQTPREIAKLKGDITFIGKPCRYGHISTRSVSNGACRECQKIWAINNKDKIPGIKKKSYLANKQKENERSSDYSRKNRDKRNAAHKKWIATHPAWYSKQRAQRDLRMPAWARTKEQQKKISAIYEEVIKWANKGFAYEVDHYYPLRGKTVCGLHVAENLDVIPAKINHMKYNKHPNEFYIYEDEPIFHRMKKETIEAALKE